MEAATVESTPVSSPDPSPAAPATSAPVQAPTTSQRPTSFEDAFARLDAAAEEKAVAEKVAPAATAQETPADPNAVPAENPDAKQGPIPFTEHKKILENARVERDIAKQELQQTQGKLSQLLNIPQAELADVVRAAKQMGSDPVGHTFGMIKHLLADPTVGPQVRSELARAFGGLKGSNGAASPPASDVMPQPDLEVTDGQGQVVSRTYSAEQLAKRDEWRDRQWQAKVDQRIAPIEQERKASADAAKAAETQKQIEARADDLIGDISEVLEISADTPKEQRDSLFKAVNELMAGNPSLSVHKAAMQVRKSHVVPKQKESATRDALDTIHKKAAGNTAGHSGAATPLKRPTNAAELAAYMRALEH